MKPRGYFFAGSALLVCGCVADQADRVAGSAADEETGLAIMAVVAADPEIDVAYLQYSITRVPCSAGEQIEPLTREVRAELLQGGIPPLGDNPLFADASRHQFADHFEVVPAGCYDVTATPLAEDTTVSADCGQARRNGIRVEDGLTTEVVLLSQCTGPAVGALDAAVAFNQPPQLLNLTYSPSKFVTTGSAATVCAIAADPNGDPIEFEWSQVGGAMIGEPAPAPDQSPPEEIPDSTSECVSITPDQAGSYDFEVRVFDLLRDETGQLVRFEVVLAQLGSPNASRDSLRFPLHASLADDQTPEEPEQPEQPEGEDQGQQARWSR
jgi:hypothetical protein